MLFELDTLILDEAGMTSAEMLQVLDAYITCGLRKAIEGMKGELGEVRTMTARSPVYGSGARRSLLTLVR